MIVARIELVTPQLECCTDGNLASDYPLPQAEEGDSYSVRTKMALESVSVFLNIFYFYFTLSSF